MSAKQGSALNLPVEARLPSFDGATQWLNSEALTPEALRGKVVAVDFGTYTCINWIRTLPYLRAWNDRYGKVGLATVVVHTPEFGVEHDVENVRRLTKAMGVDVPIAMDNDFLVWNAFANHYWPALYVADAEGRIRYHQFGEGNYEQSERVVQQLLTDAGVTDVPADIAPVVPEGVELAADWENVGSGETYVGSGRADGFASPGGSVFNEPRPYELPSRFRLNEWALAGNWTVRREDAVSNERNGLIAYQFHARDLNLILAPVGGAAVPFRVRLDGAPPRAARGLDVDEDGNGVLTDARMYQLIRQPESFGDRLFDIEFTDPGAAALCFTFG